MKPERYTPAILALALLMAVLTAPISATPLSGEDEEAAAGAAIGSVIADFKLPDASGKEHSLNALKGKNGTVLIFVSAQCPVSNGYNERMEKLAQDFKARGIHVVGINSNVAETPEAIRRHATENNLTFPILKDKGNKVADHIGAQVTPEAFFLDASNKLVYRGRIDNSRNVAAVSSSDLRDAMEAMLAGNPVAKTQARAFGCSIKRAS